MARPSVVSSTLEANKILPPFVVNVASDVFAMLVLALMVIAALEAVVCKLLFKLICPPSTVIGPAMLMGAAKVMFCVLLLLPNVRPVRVLANV